MLSFGIKPNKYGYYHECYTDFVGKDSPPLNSGDSSSSKPNISNKSSIYSPFLSESEYFTDSSSINGISFSVYDIDLRKYTKAVH